AASIDRVLREQLGRSRFATGQLGVLDTAHGVLRWLNAGHPLPLLIRQGHVVEALECAPRLPFGLNHLGGGSAPEIAEHQLEPGDGVLFYSDGIVEARRVGGEEFGADRLQDFLSAAFSGGLSPAETLRRLSNAILDHHGGQLQDDATTLLVVWRPEG
ncbi:MAG TPA: PP2C family protein-serine/threonine phosphatase, partial [Aquihabitans sp.]|nr:PP2C family protein-serine/threonine phosphatase [Aquihabitans sp.]